ncbi:MAG: TolC family outer membrane protein [Ramlibacter sp.]|nr:TolC family outer membrane protein [Ramlibacter sp.]
MPRRLAHDWPRLALAGALACASPPSWGMDLSQAYQAALEQDSTIRAARAAAQARRERLPQARAQLLPNLSASFTRFRNNLDRTAPNLFGQAVTTGQEYMSGTQSLTLRQPIYRKYQRADYEQAQAQVEEADATLERNVQNLGVRVAGAYFEALLTREHLALVLAQKTAYATQLDAARKRLSAGAGTRTDIDEAQAALDLNAAQELEARQNVDFTRRQLQALVNQPIESLAGLDPAKLRLRAPDPDRVEDWTLRAEQNSPEIQSSKAQLEAARWEVEKAGAGHHPTLDAIAQWSRNESDSVTTVDTRYTNRAVGLQLNVPLFSGGYTSSLVRQALAERQRIEESLEALRRDLGVRVHREFRGITEGVLKIKALEQAVRSADQAVISNRRSYEAGSRTLVDTLNAEQQKAGALRDLAQARYVYLMSRVRLQALAGGPKQETIDEINGYLAR